MVAPFSGLPRLAVAMIVRDEQAVLGETLDSVKPISDEIFVLDTGSTDQTPLVATESGASVWRTPWTDDFSAARNGLLELVRADWILWLDAGERLSNTSAAELREFLERRADPHTLYMLLVESASADRPDSAEQVAQPRLMPGTARLRFEGPVAESVRESALAAGLSLAVAPGRIVCHPRRHDPARKSAVALRDLKIIAAHRARGNPLTPRLLVALGEAYSSRSQPVPAEQAFLEAVRTAPRGSPEMLEAYYGLLSCLAADPAQSDRLWLAGTEALEVYPLDASLLIAMGGYLQARGRLDLAVRSFRVALEHGQTELQTWHLVETAEVAAACLAIALQIQDTDDEARSVLTDAIRRWPASVRIRRQLLDLEIKHGREDEAARLAAALLPDSAVLGALIRGACKAAQQQWASAILDLQTAYAGPCRDPLCLRWLSAALLSTGQLEAADPIVRQWHELEPDNREARTYLNVLKMRPGIARAEPQPPHASAGQSRQIRFDPSPHSADAGPAPVISQQSTLDVRPG